MGVLQQMLETAGRGIFDRAAFRAAAPANAAARTTWYDEIAIAIARGYMEAYTDFATADRAINELWREMIDDAVDGDPAEALPGFAYEVYAAFDAGEDQEDGPARCTRPALERILAVPETQRNALK